MNFSLCILSSMYYLDLHTIIIIPWLWPGSLKYIFEGCKYILHCHYTLWWATIVALCYIVALLLHCSYCFIVSINISWISRLFVKKCYFNMLQYINFCNFFATNIFRYIEHVLTSSGQCVYIYISSFDYFSLLCT